MKSDDWYLRLLGSIVVLLAVAVAFGPVSDTVTDVVSPHHRDYERLARIELGVTPQYLAEQLGTARRSIDLCTEIPCPPEAAGESLTMNLYRSDAAEVRAVFDDSGLEWYAITLLSDEVSPPMTWLDHDLGALGDVTYAQALEVAGVEPTDADMFLGARSAAYVEVVAAGAPADYQGLVLASAPDGGSGDFDRDAADAVAQQGDAPYDPAVAGPFRSASQPDTFGEFVDDGGIVSVLARDAEFDRVLLYTFATP